MKALRTLLGMAALGFSLVFLPGCSSTDSGGNASGSVYYGAGFYDPWYYGGYYDDPDIIVAPPPSRPVDPPKPTHPIATPPPMAPRPTPMPSIPSMPRPSFRR